MVKWYFQEERCYLEERSEGVGCCREESRRRCNLHRLADGKGTGLGLADGKGTDLGHVEVKLGTAEHPHPFTWHTPAHTCEWRSNLV